MKVRVDVLTNNYFHFFRIIEVVVKDNVKDTSFTINIDEETYTVTKYTLIHDRLNIIGKYWTIVKRKIEEDNKNASKVYPSFSIIQQSVIIGAIESIIKLLKDKDKSNNVKFLEITMIVDTVRKSME